MTLLYVAIGVGALGIFLVVLLATGCLKYCLYSRKARKKKKKGALSIDNPHVNHNNHDNRLTGTHLSGRHNLGTAQEMYMDDYRKASIC